MRSLRRVLGLVGVASRRLQGRIRRGDRATVALSVLGVALAVSFMVVVTGISVGLTTQSTVYGSDVDYWITPESGSSSTMAVSVGGPTFGAVHPTTDRIRGIEGVTYASPVQTELVHFSHGDSDAYVLLLGVIPDPNERLAGLPMTGLTPGDPHYADGTYEGKWTGDLVLSDAAATLLNASTGATVEPSNGAEHAFQVRAVEQATLESGTGPIPVGLVHLAELQTLTGGADQDAADRFVVQTNDPGVADELEAVYPQSRVVAQSGLTASSDVSSSEIALAIAVTAFVVALGVGALFVTTALGLDLTTDRPQHAAMTAMGLSTRSQAVVVITQTLILTTAGGLLGTIAGYGGIELTNRLGETHAGTTIATPAPGIAFYALVVAVAIGLVSSPYLVWLASRADPLTALES